MWIILVVSQPTFFFFCFYSCAPTVYSQRSSQSNPVKSQVRSCYFFALNPPMISQIRVKSLKLPKGLNMFWPFMISLTVSPFNTSHRSHHSNHWLPDALLHAPGLGLFNTLMPFSLTPRWLTPPSPSGLSLSERGLPRQCCLTLRSLSSSLPETSSSPSLFSSLAFITI